MKIHFLDVGRTKYGDCIVVQKGDKSILIDGAHPGDQARLSAQFQAIFGHGAPFEFDLLVVTHCHQDHIGCLPKLVEEGTVTFDKALVADEKLGWGRNLQDDSSVDSLPPEARKLLMALQEEPFEDASDAEVRQFIEDAATLESKYREMLSDLSAAGVTVIRYGRNSDAAVAALEAELSALEFKVLGPTTDHLLLCADYIRQLTDDAVDALQLEGVADDPGDLVAAYRRMAAALSPSGLPGVDAPLEDLAGVGSAKNDQSIVIAVGSNGKKALLTGDMQFAAAEVPDLDDEMTTLRGAVAAHGPYDVIKLSHHSSYNGFDLDVWNELSTPSDEYILVHTGGSNDAGHPSGSVLTLLKEYRDHVQFARTDRNGLITTSLDAAGVSISTAKGSLNNFQKNVPPDSSSGGQAPPPVTVMQQAPGVEDGKIDVSIKVPPSATRVTLTVELDPQKKN